MDTTGKGLVEHCEWMIEKGLINPSTGRARKIACEAVLEALDDWQSVNVSTLDVPNTLTRFKNKRARDFSPGSLDTYESRFCSALESFLQYAKDPGAWKPTAPKKPRKSSSSNGEENRREERRSTPAPGQSPEPIRSGLVDYPFPIRDGLTARLILPRDLKIAEVKRLAAFMNTLSVDFENA